MAGYNNNQYFNSGVAPKDILGVKVMFGHTYATVINLIRDKYLSSGKNHMIITANPEMLVSAQTDLEFKKVLQAADLVVPDGVGLTMAYNYLNKLEQPRLKSSGRFIKFIVGLVVGISALVAPNRYPSRVTGVQLTSDILKMADAGRHSVFILGGRLRTPSGADLDSAKDLATEFADMVSKKYPNAHIIGSTSMFSSSPSDDVATIDFISSCMKQQGISRLDILIVAYNFNAQEKCIRRLIQKLPVSVSIGVGGTLDYMLETVAYSPAMLRNLGLEWLFRLLKQPWRFKRISNAFPRFPWLIYRNSI